MRPGTQWRLALVYALPPLAVAALWISLWLADEPAANIAILDGRDLVRTGTRAEALDYAEQQTGVRPILPTELPSGGYQLTEVSAARARPPSTGYQGVYFRYDRASDEPSWFWVNQYSPGSITLPEGIGLPEIETDLNGVELWSLGEPPPEETGPSTRFQFIAKTAKYDRVISFEGAERPDMDTALEVIESMLRQD
ncbi:MAG: hypothetical protein AB7I38_04900 [Dehalococcoidia bacterium]